MTKNRFTGRLLCALVLVLALTFTMIHIAPAVSGPWWDVEPEEEVP